MASFLKNCKEVFLLNLNCHKYLSNIQTEIEAEKQAMLQKLFWLE